MSRYFRILPSSYPFRKKSARVGKSSAQFLPNWANFCPTFWQKSAKFLFFWAEFCPMSAEVCRVSAQRSRTLPRFASKFKKFCRVVVKLGTIWAECCTVMKTQKIAQSCCRLSWLTVIINSLNLWFIKLVMVVKKWKVGRYVWSAKGWVRFWSSQIVFKIHR